VAITPPLPFKEKAAAVKVRSRSCARGLPSGGCNEARELSDPAVTFALGIVVRCSCCCLAPRWLAATGAGTATCHCVLQCICRAHLT
jgi:hypothetical protein